VVIEVEVPGASVGATGRVDVEMVAAVPELVGTGAEVVVLVPLDRFDSTSAVRAEVTNEYKTSPGQDVIDMSR
jgi:hypothetical protein